LVNPGYRKADFVVTQFGLNSAASNFGQHKIINNAIYRD
jgi:hypothetical protein